MKYLLEAMLVFLFASLPACGPENVTWDFRSGYSPAVVGWTPTGPFDVGYDRTGDFDFTLIDQKGRTFHQRCFAIGCMRDTKTNQISGMYIHFKNGITADDAVPLIKEVLTKYSGGVQPHPSESPPSVDDWIAQMRAGVDPNPIMQRYTVVGKNMIGSVRITEMGSFDRGQTKCSLMFSP